MGTQIPPWLRETLQRTCDEVLASLGERCGPKLSAIQSVQLFERVVTSTSRSLSGELLHWINEHDFQWVGFHDSEGILTYVTRDMPRVVTMSAVKQDGGYLLRALVGPSSTHIEP